MCYTEFTGFCSKSSNDLIYWSTIQIQTSSLVKKEKRYFVCLQLDQAFEGFVLTANREFITET